MSAADLPARLLGEARAAFVTRYRGPPRLGAIAPGRVNLIGEHTDYNQGFVFPMAIDRHVVALAAPTPEPPARPRLSIASREMGEEIELPLVLGAPDALAQALEEALAARPERRWARYVAGVLAELGAAAGRGFQLPSLDVLIASDVPAGSGLSSSAALEVAIATLLEAAAGLALAPAVKAQLCQRAEHRWAGVPSGIMDQLTSVAAAARAALLIDCQALSWRAVTLPADLAVLVTDSTVRHALDDGRYAERAASCAAAARALGVASLRELAPAVLAQDASLPALLRRRARHVVSENARTLEAERALRDGDLAQLGALFYASHRSLRDDFEVSCPELDALVAAAAEIGPAGGVYGARLTGAGFGGATVTLVDRGRVDAVAAALAEGFRRRTGLATQPFEVRAVAGARALRGEEAAS